MQLDYDRIAQALGIALPGMAGPISAGRAVAQQMRQQTPEVPPPANDRVKIGFADLLAAQRARAEQAPGAPIEVAQAGGPGMPVSQEVAPLTPAPAMPAPPPQEVPSAPVVAQEAPPAPPPQPAGPIGLRQLAQAQAGKRQGSVFDRLSQGLSDNSGLLLALGAGFAGAPNVAEGARRAFAAAQPIAGQNQTVSALMKFGVDADTARAAARNPKIMNAIVPALFGAKDKTSLVKNYEFAKGQGFNGSFLDFISAQRAGAGEYGLQPIYGTDAQGNPVVLQLGKGGTAAQSKLPEGVKLSTGVEKVDLGTQWGMLDKKSGQFVGYLPKNVQEKAIEQELGKAQGQARATLPTDLQTASHTVTEIDSILKHEGLSEITGPLDQYRPNWTMSDKGRDALARFNQLKGRAFLQAYSTLKGGGQITEIEGLKAENAMARMDRAQGEDDFKAALRDFQDAVRVGVQKLREKAGVAPVPAMTSPQASPAPGIPSGWSVQVR